MQVVNLFLQVIQSSNSLIKRNLSIEHVTGSDVGTKWKGRAIQMKYYEI